MSEPLILVLQLLAAAYAILLPGWLLSLRLREPWPWPVRLAVGFSLGLLIVPITCFSVAWLAHTNIQWPLVLAVASGFNALGLWRWWSRRRARALAGRPREAR